MKRTRIDSRTGFIPSRLDALAAALAMAMPLATSAPAKLAIVHDHSQGAVANCDDSGPGSLREAVASASSGDTVYLGALTCSVITLTSGAIEIPQDSLDIKYYYSGEGRGSRFIIDANRLSRVFHHTGAGSVELVGLALENGRYDNTDGIDPLPALGGCVYSTGTVLFNDSTVTGCSVQDGHGQGAGGGGVYARQSVSFDHATLSANTAYSHDGIAKGGGAFAPTDLSFSYSIVRDNAATSTGESIGGGSASDNLRGAVIVRYSAVVDNTADRGGGLYVANASEAEATMNLMNSTISGNVGNIAAGAIYLRGSAGIFSSTIAFNRSGQGPGFELSLESHGMHIYSTIIADNTYGSGEDYDLGPYGYHGRIAGSHDLMVRANLLVPPDTIRSDPLLLPLADNGGGTMTHALSDGSPAIDTGTNLVDQFTYDQRGPEYPRSFGNSVDIGAYERQAVGNIIFDDGFDGS